ncbi:MAG: hypothetical protein K2J85_06045, partial [Anaeroplasmataceae bacterium]|nr:hypothetical protein [Anaeroplasmataceae bacterium]
YTYNQYLLDAEGNVAEGYNCKIPTADLNIDVRDFVFDTSIMGFIYQGSNVTELGKFIFGDNDYYYNPYAEVETYNYLYVYMTDNKVSRVLATSRIDIYTDITSMSPDYAEYFVKEVIIQNYDEQTVTFPIAESELYLPGAAKADGSLARLASAFQAMGSNYTYRDEFAFVADDEIYGIYNGSYDYYYHMPNMTRVNNSYYYYFKAGVPYAYYGSIGAEIEAENVDIAWGTPLLDLLDVNWFYEGKDGNYYCKEEYLEACSLVISRYSASNSYHRPATTSRKYQVELDFVAINLYGGKIDNIYYSGNLRTMDLYGSFTEIFSGRGVFLSVGSTTFTLPAGITADPTAPEHVLRNQDAPKFSVDSEGVLTIEASATATGYEAYVYLNNQLVEGYPKAVTNGFDFKADISADGTHDGLYTLKLVGKGDETHYKDSKLSDAVELEIYKLIKLAAPKNVVVDRDSNELKFDAVSGASKYYVQIANTNNLVVDQGETYTNVYSLSKLTEGTFIISVYAMGDNVTYRDSSIVTIRYSVEDKLAKMLEVFNESHYSKLSTTIKVNGVVTYNTSISYWYDKTLNRGKLVAKVYPSNSPVYNYSNPETIVTIYYYEENGVSKAKVVREPAEGNKTTEIFDNVDRPYKALADTPTYKYVDQSKASPSFTLEVDSASLDQFEFVMPMALIFDKEMGSINCTLTQYSSGLYSFSFDFVATDGTVYRVYNGQETFVTENDLSDNVKEA